MQLIRHVFGMPSPTPGHPSPDEYRDVQNRLEEQAQRLRAMDAQVDAQRKPGAMMHRRSGDRAAR